MQLRAGNLVCFKISHCRNMYAMQYTQHSYNGSCHLVLKMGDRQTDRQTVAAAVLRSGHFRQMQFCLLGPGRLRSTRGREKPGHSNVSHKKRHYTLARYFKCRPIFKIPLPRVSTVNV